MGEVPEDLRQAPVMFAAAALIGPFVIVLFAMFLGPSASTPLLTVAAAVFVAAVAGFAYTSYRRFKTQQAEKQRREAARAGRRVSRRGVASGIGEVSETPVADEGRERRAS